MALAMNKEAPTNSEIPFGEEMITPEDIAKGLGVSKALVYKWLNNKELPGYRFGKLWRVSKKSIDDFLIKHSSGKYQEVQQDD